MAQTTTHATQSTVVHDDPHISLNKDNSEDLAHLYLAGPLPAGEKFIRCRDAAQEIGGNADGSEDLFQIDRLGNMMVGTIQSSTLDTITEDVDDLKQDAQATTERIDDLVGDFDQEMSDAFSQYDVNASPLSLVRRASPNAAYPFNQTQFKRIMVEGIEVTSEDPTNPPHIDLINTGVLYFVPDRTGQAPPVAGEEAVYRFGHNHEEIGDLLSSGAGLEFREYENEIFLQCSKAEPNISIRTDKHNFNDDVIRIRDSGGVEYFSVSALGNIASGQMTSVDTRLTTLETTTATISGELLAHDNSLWLGSAKLSFQRNSYELRMRYLKADTIPKYLADQGYTTADLPSGKTINDMNFIRWLQSARTFTSNTALTIKDVFPAANLSNDLGDLADFRNEQVATNTTSIATNATSIAAKQDALTFSSNLASDTTEVPQASLVRSYVASQIPAVSTNIDTDTTQLASAAQVRTYVAANSGSSGSIYEVHTNDSDTSYGVTIGDTTQHVFWTRGSQFGLSGGGSMSFMLPDPANLENGHVIQFSAFQKHLDVNSSNGGTIFVKISGTASWRDASFDGTSNITKQSSTKAYFSDVDRHHFSATYVNHWSTNYWVLKTISHKLSDAEMGALVDISVPATTSYMPFHKVFSKSESQYAYVTAANYTTGDAFQLPNRRMQRLWYGDASDWSSSNPHGVVVNLPLAPEDGCCIEAISAIHGNFTQWVAQDYTKLLSIRLGPDTGVPSTRSLIHCFNGVEWSFDVSYNGVGYVLPLFANHTHTIRWQIVYSSTEDSWSCTCTNS